MPFYSNVITPFFQREDIKGKRLSTIMRILKWQLVFRVVKSPLLYNFLGDASIIVQKGLSGATGNLYFGLQEYEDMLFCVHFMRPDELFYDIGANVGIYSILASKISGARSVAFEPVPRAFKYLSANIAYNEISDRVQCIQKAVGEKQSSIYFTADLDTNNHAVDKDYNGNKIEVPVTTLTDCLNEHMGVPILAKIDTEGFENYVLAGGKSFFDDPKLRAIIIELSDSSNKLSESGTYQLLKEKGFVPVTYKYKERQLVPFSENEPRFGNTFLVRDIEEANQRMKTAPKMKVLNEMI